MRVRFYNRDGSWYADLPEYIESGGTEADCLMVSGADTWLDFLSNYGDNIVLELSAEEPLTHSITKIHEDDFGATYMAYEYNEKPINHQMWLCPVTLFVFGNYPQTIYYRIVK